MNLLEQLGWLGVGAVFILGILGILLPYSVYAAQKYAYKCFLELQKMNKKLDNLAKR